MIDPKRAAVRPRILSPETGEPLLLEEEVLALLEAGVTGPVALIGPPGSGKSAAMRHLAAVLPKESRVGLLDEKDPLPVYPWVAVPHLVVFTATTPPDWRCRATFRLAPWNQDDVIEYLLAVHPQRAAAVMTRIRSGKWGRLGGNPELWQLVLEQMARDDSIADFRHALEAFLKSHAHRRKRGRLGCACLASLTEKQFDLATALRDCRVAYTVRRVLHHPPVLLLLAAEHLALSLSTGTKWDHLRATLARDLVRTTAELLAADSAVLAALRSIVRDDPRAQPMAASLLHAADPNWRPDAEQPPSLAGAYLDGANWPGIRLLGATLMGADLSGANLQKADLTAAKVMGADLEGADLRESVLSECNATEARMRRARLSKVIATGAFFTSTELEDAELEDAHLVRASLGCANLTRADLRGVDLTQAILLGAKIEEACFAGATLREADLSGLKLREADFSGADLGAARMLGCDLEGMRLPGCNFEKANLHGALLTGSGMQVANFAGADLRNAGLADVDWEGVDLRGANLSGASFHGGSSRSGLVGSPIASEGSRTGFYTDEYDEQTYKAPEEIRKANLCHADLRGAVLDNVDFYLVDLRGARFDSEQEPYFRRCGAILEARV